MSDLQVITTTGAKGALDQAAVEGLATGLRHSEMLGAQFKHFDPARRGAVPGNGWNILIGGKKWSTRRWTISTAPANALRLWAGPRTS